MVKVKKVLGTKISLSMREVDQKTGKDLCPNTVSLPRPSHSATETSNSSISNPTAPNAMKKGEEIRRGKRLSSPERWEHDQLRMAGVLPSSMDPTYHEEYLDVG